MEFLNLLIDPIEGYIGGECKYITSSGKYIMIVNDEIHIEYEDDQYKVSCKEENMNKKFPTQDKTINYVIKINSSLMDSYETRVNTFYYKAKIKSMKRKIDNVFNNQKKQMDILLNMFPSFSLENPNCVEGSYQKQIDLLLNLQEQCLNLLNTVSKYKLDDECSTQHI
jgi:hypothetical protein